MWSTEGPVEDEGVEPDVRVQSNWSVLSWVQLQRFLSNVQLKPTIATEKNFLCSWIVIIQKDTEWAEKLIICYILEHFKFFPLEYSTEISHYIIASDKQ